MVCLLGIGADQASKLWAQKNLAEAYEVHSSDPANKNLVFYPTKVVTIAPKVFNLAYKENPAAAFSLTRSIPEWFRRPMLISVSILATLFFLYWYFRLTNDGLMLVSFSFILAGAMGNLTDRIRLGYVIDFLDVHAEFLGYPHLHWPTFNIADTLIVLGAIGVVIRTLWPNKSN